MPSAVRFIHHKATKFYGTYAVYQKVFSHSSAAAYGTVMPGDPSVIAAEIEIPARNTNIMEYLARSADGNVAPVILVCHENRGLTPHIQDVARRVAKAGYVGLAVDLLSRQGGTAAVGQENVPGALGNIQPDRFGEDFKSGWRYLQGQDFADATQMPGSARWHGSKDMFERSETVRATFGKSLRT